MATRTRCSPLSPDSVLTEVLGLLAVRGGELAPSGAPVSPLSSREMSSEVLDVCLPPCPRARRARLGEVRAPRPPGMSGRPSCHEFGLDEGLVFLPWRHGHPESPRRFAHVHSAGALPAAGEVRLEFTGDAEVALDVGDPASQCWPQSVTTAPRWTRIGWAARRLRRLPTFYGTYSFDIDAELRREGHSPLRMPA